MVKQMKTDNYKKLLSLKSIPLPFSRLRKIDTFAYESLKGIINQLRNREFDENLLKIVFDEESVNYFAINKEPCQVVLFPQLDPDIFKEILIGRENISRFKKRKADAKYINYITPKNNKVYYE
jgi:hypothetical protein